MHNSHGAETTGATAITESEAQWSSHCTRRCAQGFGQIITTQARAGYYFRLGLKAFSKDREGTGRGQGGDREGTEREQTGDTEGQGRGQGGDKEDEGRTERNNLRMESN